MLDREGTVWYSDFGQMFLGKMDAKTGKVTQYPIPETKKGFPVGTLNLEFDKNDNPWIGVMYQSAIAKFDKKTETFQTWSTPKEWDTDAGQLGHLALEGTPVDNKVWIKNSDGGNIYRLDLASNKMENLGSFKDPRTGKRIGTYGLHSDAQNNIYLLDFAAGNIVKVDAKTKIADRLPDADPELASAARARRCAKAGCGSRNIKATPSACSTRRPKRFRSGRCRRRGARPMTPRPAATARRGPAPC